MKTLVFLDIDGVLNCNNSDWSHGWKVVDSDKFDLLIELISKCTNPQIIIHSTWRKFPESRRTITELLESNQLTKGAFAFLEQRHSDSFNDKELDIEDFLDSFFFEGDKVIIIDDDPIAPYEWKDHHIQTDWETGFTKAHLIAAIDFLGKTNEN